MVSPMIHERFIISAPKRGLSFVESYVNLGGRVFPLGETKAKNATESTKDKGTRLFCFSWRFSSAALFSCLGTMNHSSSKRDQCNEARGQRTEQASLAVSRDQTEEQAMWEPVKVESTTAGALRLLFRAIA